MRQYNTRAQRPRQSKFSEETRVRIYGETGGICYYCGWPAECIDHIIPYSYGGTDDDYNLVAACNVCNHIASDLIFDDLEVKRDYIRTRLALGKQRRRWVVSFCADCHEPFRPSWGGSTLVLCRECNERDLDGAPNPVAYRKQVIRDFMR